MCEKEVIFKQQSRIHQNICFKVKKTKPTMKIHEKRNEL